MKRPQLRTGSSGTRVLGMLVIAGVFFALGASWGQYGPAAAQPHSAVGAQLQQDRDAASSSTLRNQAREVLENETERSSAIAVGVNEGGSEEIATNEGRKESSLAIDAESEAEVKQASDAVSANQPPSQQEKQGATPAPARDGAEVPAEAADATTEGSTMRIAAETEGAPEHAAGAATAAAEQARSEEDRRHMAGTIPKILHHIFIPASNPKNEDVKMWPHHKRWVQNCRLHYSKASGWDYRLWDAAASEALIAEHYSSFLDYYRNNITLANEKTDMMRYIVLHKFGGLYLDSDVDCFREAGDTMEGADVVLQGTHSGEGSGSAAIASAPGLPVWLNTLGLVKQGRLTVDNITYDLMDPHKSIHRTGPDLLADAMETVGVRREDGFFKEEYRLDGLVYRVYPVGSWYLPCQWWDQSCRRRMYQDLAIGQVDLTRLVGMHRFAGSWIPGKEEGAGIVNVTEELCHPSSSERRRLQRHLQFMPQVRASMHRKINLH